MNTTDLDFINNGKMQKTFFVSVPRETKNIIGWTGSAFMVLFSFTFFVPFALLGLSLLTIQAKKAKMNNLVLLNIISIIGFTFNYFS